MTLTFDRLVGLTERHLRGLLETAPRPLDLSPGELRAPRRARPTADPAGRLREIEEAIASCARCPLHRTRTRTVPGQGPANAGILFVGEGPGREEDARGLAFVGRAGELLTRLVTRMGMSREEVFIGNVVKCRPTVDGQGLRDRPPEPAEVAACLPFLREQIAALSPRVIVTLGNVPLEALTGRRGITRLRGQWMEFESVALMPTYHPSFLLRGGGENNARWWEVWDDMCEVLRRLSRPVPEPASKRPAAGANPARP